MSHVSVDICMGHDDDDDPKFSVSQERLAEIVEKNDAVYLEQNGGIHGIAAALCSDIVTGIAGHQRDIFLRTKTFGPNNNKDNNVPKSFHDVVFNFKVDNTIILLLCCAVLSLVIGIKTNGLRQGLVDGAILFLAILLVANFGLLCRFFKAMLLLITMKLKNQKKKGDDHDHDHDHDDVVVLVIRHGKFREIPASELVVGDVVLLKAGNRVPADGLFIDGDGVGVKHISMFSGEKVVEGLIKCHMLVTAVGNNTERNKLRNNITREEKLLEASIEKMSRRLENLWLILSLLILTVQGVRCFFIQKYSHNNNNNKGGGGGGGGGIFKNTAEEFMKESSEKLINNKWDVRNVANNNKSSLVSLLCVLLFATRDGLPLGILVLCFSSSRKLINSFGATVRKLPSCISLGLVTSTVIILSTPTHCPNAMSVPFRAMGINVTLLVDDFIDSSSSYVDAIVSASTTTTITPSDKLLILQCLRKKGGDVVALITSSLNRRDSPSLLEADIGISMIEEGEEEVEEAADVMILGQDIMTVASIIEEGRYLCKRIQTFLQFHLILNLSAFALNLFLEISRINNNNKTWSPQQITPFQLLWTNLIAETLGAFALSRCKNDNSDNKNILKKIITWRNVISQLLFQFAVLACLATKGKDILRGTDENVVSTMIFNCYVLCQVFALIGITMFQYQRISLFSWMVVAVIMVLALQVLLVEIMVFFFHWGNLDYKKWFICIGIAAVSVPVGCVVELVSRVMS